MPTHATLVQSAGSARSLARIGGALAVAFACMMHVSPSSADEGGISDEARRHFKAGVSLLQDPDGERVEEAYREFKAAYQLSQSPKILGNVGFCAMKLERDGEAIDAYSRYLRDVPDVDADERAQIVRDLQTLTVGVVRVALTVSEPGAIITDVRTPVRGDKVTNSYTPESGKLALGVRPGQHVFTVRATGFEPATWEIDAHAGSKETHDFALKKIVSAPPPPPGGGGEPAASKGPGIFPFVVVGVGVAALGTGAVTGILALGKASDISKACPDNTCPRRFDLDGERSGARTLTLVTDILLISGGALTVGGLAWWLLSPKDEKKTGTGTSAANKAHTTYSKPAGPKLGGIGGGCTDAGCFGTAKVTF